MQHSDPVTDDPWARIRPKQPEPVPDQRLITASTWTLVGSLLLAPLALVSLILGGMLTARGHTMRGVLVMCLSVVVLAFGGVLIAANL